MTDKLSNQYVPIAPVPVMVTPGLNENEVMLNQLAEFTMKTMDKIKFMLDQLADITMKAVGKEGQQVQEENDCKFCLFKILPKDNMLKLGKVSFN